MRRVIYLGFASFASFVACSSKEPEPAGPRRAVATASAAPTARPDEVGGIGFIERIVGGGHPGDRLPVIVALHGLGDRPEAFASTFLGLRAPARLILARGTEPYSGGFRWFDPAADRSTTVDAGRGGATFGAETRRVEPSVAAFITAVAAAKNAKGKPIVTGFSQGAMLAYAIAANHPSAVAAAVPIAGALPPACAPTAPGPTTPIFAFHGEADTRVPLAWDQEGVAALRAVGFRVDLQTYPGVEHTVGAEELATIEALLDRLSGEQR